MLKKFIVTTTINPPTEALEKFANMEDWKMIIIGDKKTPHGKYVDFMTKHPNVIYMLPDAQEYMYKKLSDLIGWNCIQRRNIGLVRAYHEGADIVAVVDDDNIPHDDWGKNLLIDKNVSVKEWKTKNPVFDPLSATDYKHLWHRGFPIQLLQTKNDINCRNKVNLDVLVQADFWNGDPDVDAVCRITYAPQVDLSTEKPFTSNKPMPFNSQNTFISRKALRDYFLFPHIGRMDDIWAAYWLQGVYGQCVVFNKASVFQKRNPHDLTKDMEAEMIGYKYSLDVVKHPSTIKKYIPKESWQAFQEYRKLLK